MNVGKFCPLPLCTLIRSVYIYIYVYIYTYMLLFRLSLSCATGSATTGPTSSQSHAAGKSGKSIPAAEECFDREFLQSGFGVNFYFGLANFRKIVDDFLNELSQRICRPCFSRFSGHSKKSMPKTHAQNRRRPSPISHF